MEAPWRYRLNPPDEGVSLDMADVDMSALLHDQAPDSPLDEAIDLSYTNPQPSLETLTLIREALNTPPDEEIDFGGEERDGSKIFELIYYATRRVTSSRTPSA